MDTEAEQIRRRLEELPKRANQRRYTAAVKQAVLEFIARRGDEGHLSVGSWLVMMVEERS